MSSPIANLEHDAAGEPSAQAAAERQPACSIAPAAGGAPRCGQAGQTGDALVIEACPLADVLEERFRFERLLVDVSASFVDLPLSEIDARIAHSMQRLGEYLGVDRSSFAEFSDDQRDMVVTHCYVAPGIPPFPAVIVEDQMPWYAEQVRKGAVLRFSRLPDDAPEEAVAERKYCAEAGVKSHLAIPLKAAAGLNCVLTFATFRAYRTWPDDLVERLRLIGQVFANSLSRKRFEERMWQLRDQQTRMARVALVGELAAAIAHEINQPLCAIVSNAQASQRMLSADEPDLAEVRETLQDIASDSLRASAVVSRVRGMLQKRCTERAPLQIGQAVEEVVALLSRQLSHSGVSVSIDLAEALPPILADRIQFQQVMLNLALNAIDGMSQTPDGLRQIAIRALRVGPDEIAVSVRDAGPGIGREHLETVFEPFFTTKQTGIGVGLSISRSIIESHGGRIWVESEPGQGATFHFTLPLAKDSDP